VKPNLRHRSSAGRLHPPTNGPRRATMSMPRLASFIVEHNEEILAAWEAFARVTAVAPMDVAALRGDAQAMLNVIVADLESPQTDARRARKARGLIDRARDSVQTAASEHGAARASRGFGVETLMAEFRALRASVIGLWIKYEQPAGATELEEMRRFDEAIDQAIAESLAQYTRHVESTRDRFLAVLGHDLRTPLSAIVTSSRFLLEEEKLSETQHKLIGGIEKSGQRMTQLVDDLLDLALMGLGDSIPIQRATGDLGALVREVAAEVRASAPTARLEVKTSGSLTGEWDSTRLAQALTNLLSNAIQHGARRVPIRVAVSGQDQETVTIEVTNKGRVIPSDRISGLFDAMKGEARESADRRHLGLGLYIVERIVDAHGGSVDVRSSDTQGTTFRITIPRHPVRAPHANP
jgi:signal transduction histidine kinase